MIAPLRGSLAFALLLSLAACGGGGGGVGSTPTPNPNPNPNPNPTPIDYNDAEYQRSNAARGVNAIEAYKDGATGAGIKIAILDSGLADPRGEFTGRIDPASRDVASNRGITDTDGHGTAVAAVAAADRNGSGMMGVAFDATVLALRTDDPGSCSDADGCSHFDNVLASAVDIARTNGARVINMSLGGAAMDATLRAAISRATSAGIIVVIAAGNDSDVNPTDFSQVAATADAHGLVMIAGGLDSTGNDMADFSNQAGNMAQYFLTARAQGVATINENGTLVSADGTSFAAPAVAGAVALLADAFPNLSAAQIVDLLYSTADDLGATGTDSTFGHGKLNLTEAFSPQGATSLAGSMVPVSIGAAGSLSAPMGDAAASAQAVVLDGYARAYRVDLGAGMRRPGTSRLLSGALGRGSVRRTMDMGPASVALSLAGNALYDRPWATGGTMRIALGRDTIVTTAFGERVETGANPAPPMFAARRPSELAGLDADRQLGFGISHRIGATAITVTAERGGLPALRRGERDTRYSQINLSATRHVGPMQISLGAGLLDESASVLGARFSGVLGGTGARTMLADADVALPFGEGWEMRAQWRQAWTRAALGGALTQGSLRSNAFALDLVRLGRNSRFALRAAQPMRVSRSRWELQIPTAYDYRTGVTETAVADLNLAPRGREFDVEAAYGRAFAGGWIDTNLYLRRDPGNIASARDDLGFAVRYNIGF